MQREGGTNVCLCLRPGGVSYFECKVRLLFILAISSCGTSSVGRHGPLNN